MLNIVLFLFYIKKQEYLFVCMCLYETEKPHVSLSPQQDVFG